MFLIYDTHTKVYPTYKTKKDGLKVLHFLLSSIWILFTDLVGAAEEVENQGAAGVNDGKIAFFVLLLCKSSFVKSPNHIIRMHKRPNTFQNVNLLLNLLLSLELLQMDISSQIAKSTIASFVLFKK